MRQEDKEIDGPDLEKAEERKRETELVEEKEDELYDLDGKPETTVDGKQSEQVIGAMRKILKGDQIVVNDLKLEKRQLIALEALKAAVEGKDQKLSRFMYAEDRRTMLEQALAVLQPELASMQGLGDELEAMIAQVSTLREKLNVLEDSEEELIEGRVADAAKSEGDTDDKDDENSDLDDKKKPSGKGGKKGKPARTDKAKPAQEEDTSLTGPERAQDPKSTTLTGPERAQDSKSPSTLAGPERAPEPEQPTTLGDPNEIAQAATPRWRRPGE